MFCWFCICLLSWISNHPSKISLLQALKRALSIWDWKGSVPILSPYSEVSTSTNLLWRYDTNTTSHHGSHYDMIGIIPLDVGVIGGSPPHSSSVVPNFPCALYSISCHLSLIGREPVDPIPCVAWAKGQSE